MIEQVRKLTIVKLFFIVAITLVVSVAIQFMLTPKAHAAYEAGQLIDDGIFLNAKSMNAANIQSFLASKGAGLANMSFVFDCDAAGQQAKQIYLSLGAPCGQQAPASQIIYLVSQVYGVNPQVILATMQKEQSLTTAANPTSWQLERAMGYGCPTSGGCQGASTFFYQIDNGSWVLRFHYERARGNMSWWYASSSWTCGTAKPSYYIPNLYPGQNVTFIDPYSGLQYATTYIHNAATSAFYCYTPHTFNNHTNSPHPDELKGSSRCYPSHPASGGQGRCYTGSYNFVRFFELWFGVSHGPPDYSCKNASNINGVSTGPKVIGNQFNTSNNANLTLVIPNNTGSACIEAHTWTSEQQGWAGNIATNHPAVDPANGEIISANVAGDSKSELLYVRYRNSGSGQIEIHTWDTTYQHWYTNIATNHPAVDPANGRVIAADLDGDGRDEIMYVRYRNSGSGQIEIHTWNSGYQSWASNIATNHPAVDPANNEVLAANTITDGDSKDKLILVRYRNNPTGKIELHTWNPGYQSWYNNIATNHPAVDPADNEVVAANIYGNKKEELVLARLRNSGSGKIELHTWNPGYQSWYNNIASNHPALGP